MPPGLRVWLPRSLKGLKTEPTLDGYPSQKTGLVMEAAVDLRRTVGSSEELAPMAVADPTASSITTPVPRPVRGRGVWAVPANQAGGHAGGQ